MLLQDAIVNYNTDVFDYLARDAEVPVVTRAAAQGDVTVLRVTTAPATTPVPAGGVVVVRGESGGHTHTILQSTTDPLYGSGNVFFDWAQSRSGSVVLGTLTVADGATAVLAHPEHGFLEIAAGTYRVGRQREFAGEWRLVAD